MHPTQPIPGGSDSNPYDFILSDPPKQKRTLIPKGQSKNQRIMIMVGLGLGVLTVLIVLFSLISGSSGASINNVEKAAKEQQELIRVAELGEQGARSAATQSFAIAVKLTITSSQQQFLTYLEGRDRKLKGKELNAQQDTDTDTSLKTATDSGRFDEVFTETMTDQLETHKRNLAQYYEAADTKTQKQLLQDAYVQVEGLLEEKPTNTAQ